MTVGVPERGAAQETSNDGWNHAPCIFACVDFLEGVSRRIWLKGILVEQDGEVRVACVCNELIGDVRNVITGFLKFCRM